MTLNNQTVLIGTSAASFVLGSAVSYFITKKVLQTRFDALVEKELQEAKEYYARRAASDEVQISKKAHQEMVKHLAYKADSEPEPERTTTYLDNEPLEVDQTFNYEDELKNRTTEKPYVIHVDEFMTNESEYDQVSITYYEGDDVLADEKDSPVPDPDAVIGQDNLERFGHGSKDNRVVYIRNDILQMEFEVIHRDGDYAKEVLGFIEHSDSRGRPRKFRNEDG